MSEVPSSSLWQIVDSVAIVFSRAYMLARTRAASHASPIVRLLARRDHAHFEARLLERELVVFRAQRHRIKPHHRPHYGPEQRAEILQLMALRDWSAKKTAERFALHPNTIRAWQKAARRRCQGDRLLGEPPWNKLHDSVRWLVHELRRMCPEREFGTRTIARHILRAGIQISRTSVRRILAEEPPKKPRWRKHQEEIAGSQVNTRHLLHPSEPNRVWHLDITSIQFLWMHLRIAGIVDGYSRRLLALRLYSKAPTSGDMSRLIRRVARREGRRPRFMITDHGCQFRQVFEESMEQVGITLVRGRVGSWRLNSKIERVFRTLKLWQRVVLLGLKPRTIQRKLDDYRLWYNRHRPHTALGFSTPDEVARGFKPPKPIPIRRHGEIEPVIRLKRHCFGDDPHLPVIEIDVRLRRRPAA
jgi:putative transposase